MNVADAPRKQKSPREAEPPASESANGKTAGEGTELKSVQDVLSICRDTRTLSRQDHKERAGTMRRVREYLDASSSPLDPAEAEALSQTLDALRYTPTRLAPVREGGGTPYEQLLKARGERQQAWDELMQSLHRRSR
jgi:hypothetical protein